VKGKLVAVTFELVVVEAQEQLKLKLKLKLELQAWVIGFAQLFA
jgi:hypothetical protein